MILNTDDLSIINILIFLFILKTKIDRSIYINNIKKKFFLFSKQKKKIKNKTISCFLYFYASRSTDKIYSLENKTVIRVFFISLTCRIKSLSLSIYFKNLYFSHSKKKSIFINYICKIN